MDPNEQFRLFIALSVPSAVKDSIERAQTELAQLLPPKAARWTRREQFHLTLVFLGDVAAGRVQELIEAGCAACRPFAPLRLTAAQIGFFPERRFPRVLWAGVSDATGELSRLWTAVQNAMQPFTGEAAEKEYVGHVTLARLNRLQREQSEALAKTAKKYEASVFGSWTADRLELMRSELLPQGARHTVLADLPLVDAGATQRVHS